MDIHEDSEPSPSDENWSLLSFLPYCPSKEDIARETKHLYGGIALPFAGNEEEEVEPFYLDDSDFGKVPTVIVHRDPQASCKSNRGGP